MTNNKLQLKRLSRGTVSEIYMKAAANAVLHDRQSGSKGCTTFSNVNIERVVFLVGQKLEEKTVVQWGHIKLQDISPCGVYIRLVSAVKCVSGELIRRVIKPLC
jgi:hypothetical protein